MRAGDAMVSSALTMVVRRVSVKCVEFSLASRDKVSDFERCKCLSSACDADQTKSPSVLTGNWRLFENQHVGLTKT